MQQILNAHALRSLKTSQGMSLKTPTNKRPQAHTKKVHRMTNTNQSTSPQQETERSVFSALIYWKDDEDGIEQWGTEVLIALYDDDEECEDTFWHHQGTEESFFVDFAKDNKRNQEDFYAEKID